MESNLKEETMRMSNKTRIISEIIEKSKQLSVQIDDSECSKKEMVSELNAIEDIQDEIARLRQLIYNTFLENIKNIHQDNAKARDQLADADEIVKYLFTALQENKIALKEVLRQIQENKTETASQIHSRIERIILPILRRLNDKVGPAEKNEISLLRSSLKQVTIPFVSKLELIYGRLTPREVEICNMIKGGLSSKEIASLLNTSWETVRNQRKHIRKKLGITGEKISLTSVLKAT